jgi:hypothetical protein
VTRTGDHFNDLLTGRSTAIARDQVAIVTCLDLVLHKSIAARGFLATFDAAIGVRSIAVVALLDIFLNHTVTAESLLAV